MIDRLGDDLAYLAEGVDLVLDMTGLAYFHDLNGDLDGLEGGASLRAEFIGPLLDNWEIAFVPELHVHSEDYIDYDFRIDGRGLDRPFLNVGEFWLRRYEGPVSFTVGKQIFSWGQADLYNPTDDLNASDRLDPPEAFKLADPAVAVKVATTDFGAEAVLLPWFVPDRLPGEDNRFTRPLDGNGAPPGTQFVAGERNFPKGASALQYGLRVSSSTLADGWDLSASAFRGVSKTPIVLPTPVAPGVVALDSFFARYVELGAGFSTIFEEIEFHGEAAWHISDKSDEDDDYVSMVAGLRKSWSDLGMDDLEEIQLTVEYAREDVTRSIDSGTPFLQSSFDRTFVNSILGQIDLKFDDDTKFVGSGALNLDDLDGAMDAYLDHKINDTLMLRVGAQFFFGPSDSFFGVWRNNDRLYFNLKVFQ